MDFEQLRAKVRDYLSPEKITAVEEAYNYAKRAHEGQVRLSGEPYLEHPLHVALTLAELRLDASSLSAALLHDVPEDCGIPLSEIEKEFGAEVARLVDGNTKLSKLTMTTPLDTASKGVQAENLRKMLVAMAEDLRVVFIKLADRLHNMLTLDALPPDKQHRIAQETAEIFAPLAHRLGIWELKWQLEDLAFRYLEPEEYHRIASLIAAKRSQREDFINQVIGTLKAEFDKQPFRAEVSGRPKHIYSVYQKMKKYAALGKHFDDIHDLLALRVLVSSVADCYAAVGVIHNMWHPLPEEFDDFIANPKPNGYQSLHTTILFMGRTPLEIQIRTYDMHYIAEYGVAAHWRYKEGDAKDIRFEERIAWLRQLVDWHREFSGAEEFLESVKTDIFIDQVFVFTPRGEIKDLPKGSTPIDFAYRIHTELGHRCIGAKVNGRLVPLNYELKNGDVVEVVLGKEGRGPSRDWLNPSLGYVQTSDARSKIRLWFKKQARPQSIDLGRELLEKEFKRLGVKLPEREELAKQYKYDDPDDFLAAIGYGDLSAHQIALKLVAEQQPRVATRSTPSKVSSSSVQVLGTGDVLTHLAQCCHPVPGDKITGYITRSRGVTVHRQDCYNVVHEDEKERLVQVEWGGGKTDLYPVSIQVDAWDRVGLARDITAVIAGEKVNISLMSVNNREDSRATLLLTLETSGLEQLSDLVARIEKVRGVVNVTRIGGEAITKTAS